MRREELPDIRRALVREADAVRKAGGQHPFDNWRPWHMVWQRAVSKDADSFWTKEFVTPATLVRLHLKTMGEVVDGDAPVDGNVDNNLARWASGGDDNRYVPIAPKPPTPQRPMTRTTPNRVNKNARPCASASRQDSATSKHKGDVVCPQNRSGRRQCAK